MHRKKGQFYVNLRVGVNVLADSAEYFTYILVHHHLSHEGFWDWVHSMGVAWSSSMFIIFHLHQRRVSCIAIRVICELTTFLNSNLTTNVTYFMSFMFMIGEHASMRSELHPLVWTFSMSHASHKVKAVTRMDENLRKEEQSESRPG